jgi:hypothetical protein
MPRQAFLWHYEDASQLAKRLTYQAKYSFHCE